MRTQKHTSPLRLRVFVEVYFLCRHLLTAVPLASEVCAADGDAQVRLEVRGHRLVQHAHEGLRPPAQGAGGGESVLYRTVDLPSGLAQKAGIRRGIRPRIRLRAKKR